MRTAYMRRGAAALIAVIMALLPVMPAEYSFAAVKSIRTWTGDMDRQLNKMNGLSYWSNLPGQHMYACVGYAEWAMNRIYNVSPAVPHYSRVRHIRNYFVKHKTPLVAYGYYTAKKYGGDGKIHEYGDMQPGDIIFFFKRGLVKKKVRMKPIKDIWHADIHGRNQWVHIAVVSGYGSGINAKVHDNSTHNPNKGVDCSRTIKKILKMYNGSSGATDYQVFRVLSDSTQKMCIRNTCGKYRKEWHNRTPDFSDVRFRVNGRKVKSGKNGIVSLSGKYQIGKKIKISEVAAPEGFSKMKKTVKTVKVKSGVTEIVINRKPIQKTAVINIVLSREDPENTAVSLKDHTFRIWPKKYGRYSSVKGWWKKIPDEVKCTIKTDENGLGSSIRLPAESAVFNGKYYICQTDAEEGPENAGHNVIHLDPAAPFIYARTI